MGKIVGILGGMGPLATADLYQKIIVATPARCDQEHLHVVIEADPTVPDRSAFLQGDGEDPLPALTRGARRLAAADVDFIAIPCNTAHAFLPTLRERVAVPFLDMIAETAARVRTEYPGARRVGILATVATVRPGLYHAASREHDLEPMQPNEAAQRLVSAAIAAVKGGDTGPTVSASLVEASRALIADGAEVLLAACTELPLVLTAAMVPMPLLDPTQVLAEAVVREGRAASLVGVGR